MVVNAEPGDTLEGRIIPGQPSVIVYDAGNNPLSGIDISVTLNQNNFSVGSTTTITSDGSGLAEFSNLVIDDIATGYEITFTADAFPAVNITSSAFDIHEELYTISILNQPTTSVEDSVVEGSDVINHVLLLVEDMSNNPVLSGSINVGLNKGSFTAQSVLSATINNGIAEFDSLFIDLADVGYTLTFSSASPNVESVSSNSFDVVAEVASMSMYTDTRESIEGITLYGPPTVYIENGSVPQAGIDVTAYLSKERFVSSKYNQCVN
jgi:hypothetical protein